MLATQLNQHTRYQQQDSDEYEQKQEQNEQEEEEGRMTVRHFFFIMEWLALMIY